jgi:uncharacterized membrane-anchored protein YhcB (DUF1043 family)
MTWFVIGMVAGVIIGILIASLCAVSGRESLMEEIRGLRRKLGETES